MKAMLLSRFGGPGELIEAEVPTPQPAPDQMLVRDFTDGAGVDCVLEIAGVPTFPSSVRSIRTGGRMVIVGTVQPGMWPFNPALSILKELEFIGSAHASLNDLRTVIRLVAERKVVPEIGRVMPMCEAAEAHRAMEAKEVTGRVVLVHDHALAA